MRNSADYILTTHVGSLPRPDDLIALAARRQAGERVDPSEYETRLRSAVADVVRKQVDTGIGIPGDGEFGKEMGQRVNFGAWWSYIYPRLTGLRLGSELHRGTPRRAPPGEVVLTAFNDRRDRVLFAAAYADPDAGVSHDRGGGMRVPVAVDAIKYSGQQAVAADIAHFKAAMAENGVEEGFMSALAPGICARIGNEYYKSDEELVYACADALREEYTAIVNAGLILQLDDPSIATNWDMVNPQPTLEDYTKYIMIRVEALNHAIRGLPKDRIRFHLCWGSWHGPHVTDLPMRDLINIMLRIDVGAYSFEAANVRHEHEWKIWRESKRPDGKILIPGIVSHATNVVEHPELVCDRIVRFAGVVGRENVIASTDCGLGGRIHPDIAWAKLQSLTEGAALATKQLWG